MHPIHLVRSIAAGVLVVLAYPAVAEPQQNAQPVASSTVTGTMLVVSPKIAYESAIIRISGPEGYELTKRLAFGEAVIADIATEQDASEGDRSIGAPGTSGRLHDGRYGYEVIFNLGEGSIRKQVGFFRVEGGSLMMPPPRSGHTSAGTQLDAGSVESGMAEGGPSEEAAFDDLLTVLDTAGDGATVLALNSTPAAPEDTDFWRMQNDNGLFQVEHIHPSTGLTEVVSIETSGQVGIGTTVPSQELHIDSSDGGDIRLTRNGGAASNWFLGITGGDDRFGIQDHSAGVSPSILSVHQGAPPTSLDLTPTGVGVGTASPSAKLHVAGSFRTDGDVALSSSRAMKTGFGSVDSAEVLAKVADLPVASWRYKSEEESTRHIGPFAEDFQRLFGLGDGKTISVIDAQGVTLAAIQGLQQELAEKEVAIAELRSDNAELTARLLALEERLDR